MKTTQKKFWEILATTRGWKLIYGGSIRRLRRNGDTVCPVCEVANIVTGKSCLTSDDILAAKAIGLDARFASRIAAAADWEDGSFLKPTPKTVALRRKLVRLLKPKLKRAA